MSERICSVEGCGKKHKALGLCGTHYASEYAKKYPARVKSANTKYYKRYPERVRTASAEWKKKNPERVRTATAEWRKANPEGLQEIQRRQQLKKYGIEDAQYMAAWELQGGLCAIGNHSETRVDYRTNVVKRLSVDHDHSTGENRGLLCSACNVGLGHFREDPVLLRAAAEYLEIHIALRKAK